MEKISSSLLKYFLQFIQTFAMIESNAKVCVSVPTKIKRKMIAIWMSTNWIVPILIRKHSSSLCIIRHKWQAKIF